MSCFFVAKFSANFAPLLVLILFDKLAMLLSINFEYALKSL